MTRHDAELRIPVIFLVVSHADIFLSVMFAAKIKL